MGCRSVIWDMSASMPKPARSSCGCVADTPHPSFRTLSQRLGYACPECVPGIIRRIETWKGRNAQIQQDLLASERTLNVPGLRAGPDLLNEEQGKVKPMRTGPDSLNDA